MSEAVSHIVEDPHGFYHPLRGYWQTLTEPSLEILNSYPEGTIPYPLKPGEHYFPEDGGWTYVKPPTPPIELSPVSRRKLRLTLVRNQIPLSRIEELIAAMPEGLEKEEAQIEWADATEFDREHPTLLLIAEALNLSKEKVDEMWIEAMAA